MGTLFNDAFYTKFAAKLSDIANVTITAYDVGKRICDHRDIYRSSKVTLDKFSHPNIVRREYCRLLRKCFAQKNVVRVSRHLGNGSPSCGSSSSIARTVVQAPTLPIATDPNIRMQAEFGRILAHLRGQHGLSANRITLFSKYLEQNRLAS